MAVGKSAAHNNRIISFPVVFNIDSSFPPSLA